MSYLKLIILKSKRKGILKKVQVVIEMSKQVSTTFIKSTKSHCLEKPLIFVNVNSK